MVSNPSGTALTLKVFVKIVQVLRSSLCSRVAWAFVCLHTGIFFVALHQMGPPSRVAAEFWDSVKGADWSILAGRPFHLTYEPGIVKALIFADIPAMLLAGTSDLIVSPLTRLVHIGTYEASYIAAAEIFVAGTLQWLAIGRFTEFLWSGMNFSKTPA